jgi:hypothetical protein
MYEQCTMPDPSYLGQVVMIAGIDDEYAASYGNGQINYATRHYFNLEQDIVSNTYLYPESGLHGLDIRKKVADGLAFANYAGHGDESGWSHPSFQRLHVRQLHNKHKYCLALGNCCRTSRFNIAECFAETWLRAEAKGAIGYIGAANDTYWDEDYWWSVGYGPVVPRGAEYSQTSLGAYDGMFHDHGENIEQWYVVQDALIFCGNLGVEEAGSALNAYYWRVYNLMGDPSLSPFIGVPAENEISHDPWIPPEDPPLNAVFRITAEPNSYVGLTKNGMLVGSSLVGASGYAEIEIVGHGTDGSVRLCVTCQNRFPYRVDVPIAPLGAIAEGSALGRSTLSSSPNPFGGSTEIRLSLGQPQMVSLQIHDVAGRLVQTILNKQLQAGTHQCAWDGRGTEGQPLPEGVYLVRLATEDASTTLSWKMILNR